MDKEINKKQRRLECGISGEKGAPSRGPRDVWIEPTEARSEAHDKESCQLPATLSGLFNRRHPRDPSDSWPTGTKKKQQSIA